jgi:aspartyl protease family protein
MHRFLLFAGLASVASVYISGNQNLINTYLEPNGGGGTQQITASASPAATKVSLSIPGHEEIKAGPNGHFQTAFRVNGREIEGLVDTGATFVTLNETMARRIGVSSADLDYRYAVTTANGATHAAHINIDRVEVGGVRVRNVEAFVLKDQSLSGMLIGMSFMNKLKSYKVANGVLYLKN